jgi:hypothetical protein
MSFAIACAFVGAAAPALGVRALPISSLAAAPAAAASSYDQMTDAQKNAYAEQRAARIAARIAGSKEAVTVPADAVRLIRRELDGYAARASSTETRPWHDNIRNVLGRGALSAPVIRKAFEAEGVPHLVGLYVAMIESEYNECPTSSMGAKGPFQMLPATAQRFGTDPADLCDLAKSAATAARYLKSTRGQFGADAFGATASILSYNQGERQVSTAYAEALGAQSERTERLWAELSKTPDTEGTRYLASFFAAAIVGENPRDFGVAAKPLSKY